MEREPWMPPEEQTKVDLNSTVSGYTDIYKAMNNVIATAQALCEAPLATLGDVDRLRKAGRALARVKDRYARARAVD